MTARTWSPTRRSPSTSPNREWNPLGRTTGTSPRQFPGRSPEMTSPGASPQGDQTGPAVRESLVRHLINGVWLHSGSPAPGRWGPESFPPRPLARLWPIGCGFCRLRADACVHSWCRGAHPLQGVSEARSCYRPPSFRHLHNILTVKLCAPPAAATRTPTLRRGHPTSTPGCF